MRAMTVAVGLVCAVLCSAAQVSEEQLRVLLVTGGHGFDRPALTAMLNAIDGIRWTEAEYRGTERPDAAALLSGDGWKDYDVFVFYDMFQGLSQEGREGILALAQAGKGLVMLHHTLAAHQDWPEYKRLVGGKYITRETVEDGVTYRQSTYAHDMDMTVAVCDTSHPITFGMSPFTIRDETYKHFVVLPGVTPLLTTDHPRSEKVVGWTHLYRNSRVVYIQLGHDAHAYGHPAFATLVARSIRYTAGRPAAADLPWRALFDGRSLDGWEAVGGARWGVADGILTGRQGPEYAAGDLFTTGTFDDFEAVCEFRVQWPANSGLWFRYRDHGTAYQADILEVPNPRCWTGTLYCGGKMFLAMNTDATLVRKDDWNTFVIRAAGRRLAVFLNGRKVADVVDDSSREGKFGIQVHRGKEFAPMRIDVRKLDVRRI